MDPTAGCTYSKATDTVQHRSVAFVCQAAEAAAASARRTTVSDSAFNPSSDPFSKFWGEMLSRMGMGAFATPGSPEAAETMEKTRKAFFDAWAQYCDEYLRSEQFLQMLKQTMDNALTFRQQVQDFLTQLHQQAQTPTTGDVSAIVAALKSGQDRLHQRLDEMERKLSRSAAPAKRPAAMKTRAAAKPAARPSAKPARKAKAAPRRKKR